jgi:hypothetical protein
MQSENTKQTDDQQLVIPMNYQIAYETVQGIANRYMNENINLQVQLQVTGARYKELLEYCTELEGKLAALTPEKIN